MWWLGCAWNTSLWHTSTGSISYIIEWMNKQILSCLISYCEYCQCEYLLLIRYLLSARTMSGVCLERPASCQDHSCHEFTLGRSSVEYLYFNLNLSFLLSLHCIYLYLDLLGSLIVCHWTSHVWRKYPEEDDRRRSICQKGQRKWQRCQKTWEHLYLFICICTRYLHVENYLSWSSNDIGQFIPLLFQMIRECR